MVATWSGVTAGLGALRDDDVAARLDRCDRRGAPCRTCSTTRTLLSWHRSITSRGTPSPATNTRAPPSMTDCTWFATWPGHRGEQVDAERLVRQLAHLADLLDHPLVAHRRGAEAAEAAGLGDRGDEAVVRHASHPGQHHGVFDFEDIGQAGAHGGAWYAARCAARPVTSPGDERGGGPRLVSSHRATGAARCEGQAREAAFHACVVGVNGAGPSAGDSANAPSRSRNRRCQRLGVRTIALGSSSNSQRAKFSLVHADVPAVRIATRAPFGLLRILPSASDIRWSASSSPFTARS